MSRFRQKLPWPVVVGFFAGSIGGIAYEIYKSGEPYTRPLQADDLHAPDGFTPAPPPPGLNAKAVIASWRRGNDSILVMRTHGEPIDNAGLEKLAGILTSKHADAVIQNKELHGAHDQSVGIVEAATAGTHLRYAVVGGPAAITFIRWETLADDRNGFQPLFVDVAYRMSTHRFEMTSMANSWVIRGMLLGMLAGAFVVRLREHRRAKPATPPPPA